MKKLITLVLVALLTLSMTACGNGGKKEEEPTGPITITFWYTLTDQHLRLQPSGLQYHRQRPA